VPRAVSPCRPAPTSEHRVRPQPAESTRPSTLPQRFYLTAHCVMWDLAEVMVWLQSRRQVGSNGVKKAPKPDFRQRVGRPSRERW
jgi:hypothetical protein